MVSVSFFRLGPSMDLTCLVTLKYLKPCLPEGKDPGSSVLQGAFPNNGVSQQPKPPPQQDQIMLRNHYAWPRLPGQNSYKNPEPQR
ncbi:hypothetical protein LZ554_000592 [Drepanopeziza brunnea f. sp. 'monogermtubi']|nr:hypothetical protein LZ554_000592 [Drepanopeziza brunnea f. sp. 'monogermtubi']